MNRLNQSGRRLAVFVPSYNAAASLEAVIERIPNEAWDLIEQVFIIDDGSNDETLLIAKKLSERNIKIEAVSQAENQGYGRTVRHGMQLSLETDADYFACLHADGQYPPELLVRFVDHMHLNQLDLLQGSRHRDGGALKGGMPIYKYAAGKILTTLENLAFGLKLTDYHSGFIVYSRRALETVAIDELSSYFDFDLEFIACARRRGLAIDELAIPTYYGEEVSYLNPLLYGLRVLVVIAKYLSGQYDEPSIAQSKNRKRL